ncbi:hypothetical protein [Enhygromyxa salina]|uniref:Uncharacterized protein n=1 Tax=Enhygromyxa salina TaxID=215803 RepID=A0A2S9XTA0_9BACT|nr:hypothetical protein [Enhygromyxa salina]PRP96096.1 hypothetical protein ENSA7_69100 [Enhygromyxa salina]
MTKRAKKRQSTQTPSEWVDIFAEHDDALVRVRILWRRGGGRYRPIVPVNLTLEDLEVLDFEEWEDLELPETNFDWSVPVDEHPDARERRLADNARELWAVAVLWSRAKGPVCDFQLRGYGSDDEILFEDGKRCNLSGEQSRYDGHRSPSRARCPRAAVAPSRYIRSFSCVAASHQMVVTLAGVGWTEEVTVVIGLAVDELIVLLALEERTDVRDAGDRLDPGVTRDRLGPPPRAVARPPRPDERDVGYILYTSYSFHSVVVYSPSMSMLFWPSFQERPLGNRPWMTP